MSITTDRNDPGLREVGPDGQQRAYIVLPEPERAVFVRPVRTSYRHEVCGAVTTMGTALAETYAVNPTFYGATFCATCHAHFSVGEHGQFTWLDGTKVGT